MKCPKCGNENHREGAKVCSQCRTPLAGSAMQQTQSSVQSQQLQQAAPSVQQVQTSPLVQTQSPSAMAQGVSCAKCGNTSHRLGAKVCSKCRAPLAIAIPAPNDYVALDEMRVRLDELKEEIQEEYQKNKDLKVLKKILVFQGDTGTGKTAVADSFTFHLLNSVGMQASSIITKWARDIKSDLEKKGIKPNEDGIKEYLDQLRPGAIIIDEAVEDEKFLHELIIAFTRSKHNFISILVGTKNIFSQYFEKNEYEKDSQLIHDYYDFPEQSYEELAVILKQKLVLDGFTIDTDAEAILQDYISEEKHKDDVKHKNGHLVEKICFSSVKRLQKANWKAAGSDPAQEKIIKITDIPLKEKPKTVNEILADLDAMVGMTEVKKTVREIANKVRFSKQIAEEEGAGLDGEGNHIVITGNPGTGKTTIVRTLGALFRSSGLLPSDKIIEVQGTGLKDEWVGKSKERVNKFCDSAEGGILFIDEAYTLTNDSGPIDEFAAEAIATLLTRLENDRDKYVCVIAGYPKQIETFLKVSNPGMKSRFKHYINIPDYTADELIEIFERFNVEKKKFTITEEAKKRAREVIRDMVLTKDEYFGNAREVRNLFEKVTTNIASRITKLPFDEQMQVNKKQIEKEDISWSKKEAIPIDKVLEDLDAMVGMKEVKKTVRELAQKLQMQQERIEMDKAETAERGEEYKPKAPDKEKNNIVITGNPGTGKTTIVRTLAKLFYSIGLTSKDTIIECLGEDLMAGYEGQTKDKVHKFCNDAMGGILFIDEAYTLTNEKGPVNDYANQAITTLMARMENDGHKFITVIAGYKKQIELFLDKSNQGMRRRFVHEIDLPDYTAEELIKIFVDFNVKKAGYTLTDDAMEEVQKVIRNMVAGKGENFGNAGEMGKLFSFIRNRQSSRLYELSKEERRDKRYIIEKVDIQGSEEKNLSMEEVLADLEAMTGMTEVKKKVRSMATLIATEKKREDLEKEEALKKGEKWEPKADTKTGNHIILTGNPGTGKTTITRTLAKLFKAIGLLPTDKIVEINANDLKGAVIGESKNKANEYCRQAMGGVLFIDEAYVLANEHGPVDSYAKEASEVLMTHLENAQGKFICIAAGYENNMGLFLDKLNQGMRRRFTHFINIADYSADELYEIFANSFVKKGGFTLTDEAKDTAKKAIDAMVRKKLPTFGNAGEMRRLYEDVKRRQSERVSALPEDQKTLEVFNTLEAVDIGEAVKPISIDDVLKDLDAMVGMQGVKDTVRALANTVEYNKQILEATGKMPEGEGNNICITGNPGTGKTTIVRIIAKLFRAIGLLPDDNLLEITGNDLKGVFIGESKEKVNEYCRQAMGRVFLIDEAYSLVSDSRIGGGIGPIDQYAEEAISTLITHLENSRDKFVCVVAGYEKEMNDFIKFSNPGTESRFKHYIKIPDYTADELIEIFERFNVAKGGYTITDTAKEKARNAIRKMVETKSRNFGNARDIRNFFEKIKSNTATRVMKLPSDKRIAVLQLIEAEDIPD